MKMTPKTSFLVVALMSFAIGIAVDRLLLSSGRDPGARLSGGDARRTAPASGDARRALTSSGIPGEDHTRREGSHGDRGGDQDEPAGDAESLSFQMLMDRLDREGPVDFSAVAALSGQLPPGRRRREVVERLASRWGRKDPSRALAWVDELSGMERSTAMEHILHEWAQTDPASAADYVAQLPNSEHSLHLVRRIAEIWAENDRASAMEWGLAQTDPAARERALGGVLGVWSSDDPAAAAAFASTLDNPYERHEVFDRLARNWVEQDPSEAMEWAQSLPAGERESATTAILSQLAEFEPELAASIYEDMTAALPEENPQAREYRRMAQELAARWSSSNPRDAAAWATGLPENGEIRRHAVGNVVENWLRLDSMAASEWVGQLPDGAVRDSAADRVVNHIAHSDPEGALAWASTISDQGHQTELMRHVLDRWSSSDPDAARGALDQVDLPAEQRDAFNHLFEPEFSPKGSTNLEQPGSNGN